MGYDFLKCVYTAAKLCNLCSRILSIVCINNMMAGAGKGPVQSQAGGVAHTCLSLLLNSGSALSSKPKEAGKFFTKAPGLCVWLSPLPDRLICECAELQRTSSLTTERCFVSLPDTPAKKAGFTCAAGSGLFYF